MKTSSGFGVVGSAVLIMAGVLFALSVVQDALAGFNYGSVPVKWSSDSQVFWTELGLAAVTAVVLVVAVWNMMKPARPTAWAVMWFGFGMLGLGILSALVGQTGFRIIAPIDGLERRELVYIALGVPGAVIGALIGLIGGAFVSDVPQ